MARPFFTYMLRCADDSYYVGHTDNIEKRLSEHQSGEGCEWTSNRLPVELVWLQEFVSREEARVAEYRIKGWSRAKKEALIKNDWEKVVLLASRSKAGRALRDALRAPQEHGKRR